MGVLLAAAILSLTQFLVFPAEGGVSPLDLVGEGVVVLVLAIGLFVVRRVGERKVYWPLIGGVTAFFVFALADFLDEFSAQPEWFAMAFENGTQTIGTLLLVVGLYRWTVVRRERETELRHKSERLMVLNRVLQHDIRDDTMVIRGWASVIQKDLQPESDRRLDQIIAASNGIIELTESTEEFTDALVSDGTPDLEPRPLADTLSEELQKVQARYDDAHVEIAGTLPTTDVLAHSMLPTVFRNLLANAIEHNDAAAPTVTVEAERTDETVTVRIADNGPGIPDERKDRIFGVTRVEEDAATSDLGLPLVAAAVEQFGGDVFVEDGENGGAVFVVVLRVADAREDRERINTDTGASAGTNSSDVTVASVKRDQSFNRESANY